MDSNNWTTNKKWDYCCDEDGKLLWVYSIKLFWPDNTAVINPNEMDLKPFGFVAPIFYTKAVRKDDQNLGYKGTFS